MLTFTPRKVDVSRAVRFIAETTQQNAVIVMEAVGQAMLQWLETRGPETRGWTARSASGLAESYSYKVRKIPGGARLMLRNSKFYGMILEQRDGLFVLTGVTDPGGPVEQKLAEVVAKIAPSMRIVRAG